MGVNLAGSRRRGQWRRRQARTRERHRRVMSRYFTEIDGKQPWGHLWAITLPCHECRRHFPLIGALALRQVRHPLVDDPARLDGVRKLGVGETAFLSANGRHSTIFALSLIHI